MKGYVAFLSYSHGNTEIAKRIHREIESFRPPRKIARHRQSSRLYPVFKDRAEVRSGGSLSKQISDAINGSGYLIVLCSTDSAKSKWVNEEINLFHQIHGPEKILPVIVEGEPPECFPPALTNIYPRPAAADLRRNKDGFHAGTRKVIASLLDVSFADLQDRDAARRQRQVYLASALAAVFCAMAVFAWFSNVRSNAFLNASLETINSLTESIDQEGLSRLDVRSRFRLTHDMLASVQNLHGQNRLASNNDRVLHELGKARWRHALARWDLGQKKPAMQLMDRAISSVNEHPKDPVKNHELFVSLHSVRGKMLASSDIQAALEDRKAALEHAEILLDEKPGKRSQMAYYHSMSTYLQLLMRVGGRADYDQLYGKFSSIDLGIFKPPLAGVKKSELHVMASWISLHVHGEIDQALEHAKQAVLEASKTHKRWNNSDTSSQLIDALINKADVSLRSDDGRCVTIKNGLDLAKKTAEESSLALTDPGLALDKNSRIEDVKAQLQGRCL